MKGLASSSPLVNRDHLIEKYRSYVSALAQSVAHTLPVSVDLNDLESYGQIGLIEAADRYDPRRGVSFSTFAYYRIRGAIYDGLREMGILSRSAHSQTRFTACADDLLQTAADDETSNLEGRASESIEDNIASAQRLIDALIPSYLLSLSSDQVPQIVDQEAFSIKQVETKELTGFLMSLLKELSEEEQQLIDNLYFKHLSMTQLAAQRGITKSWVSRLHARAINHLRELMQKHRLIEATV